MAGKIPVRNRSIIALFWAAILFATPILAQEFPTEEAVSDYVQGRRDGRRQGAADASMIWVIPGCCCCLSGVAVAYLLPQSVPTERLVGKSPEYVKEYTLSYKMAKRDRETIYAAAGCLIGNIGCCIYSSLNPPSF